MSTARHIISLVMLLWAATAMGGRVDSAVIHSTAMNRDIRLTVVVPERPADARGTRYPVVYMLHGAYGDEKAWLTIKPELPGIADREGMIFVTAAALNSWYFDSPVLEDYRYETFFTHTLIHYIDSLYPTQPRREARAITGLSMGGHGALYLAMRHKDLYGACGSMSGGVDIRPFPRNWNIPDVLGEMAANKKRWDEHTVVGQLDSIANGDLRITFDCGEDDFFLEVNKDLHKRLLGRGIDHDFTTRPGGHSRTYWANSIDYHLLFFHKYFADMHTLVTTPEPMGKGAKTAKAARARGKSAKASLKSVPVEGRQPKATATVRR